MSLSNGCAKFLHTQESVSPFEVQYMTGYLHHMFPDFERHSVNATDAEVLAQISEHAHKAAGEPWCWKGATNKGDALRLFGLSQLRKYYSENTVVVGSTLKDEIRLVGKDARLFRPQDVSSYVEGSTLYYHQNEYLMKAHESPIFIKFVVPGLDIPKMFDNLEQLHGQNFASDGIQWDSHYPLILAAIIAEFRSCGELDPLRVQRYYSMMYNGFTSVLDGIVHLVGQPSGHYNTSVDNSLAHLLMFALHACRKHWTYEELDREVRYYTCGDDLIWSTLSDDFIPSELERTYNSVGMYLEFESYVSKDVNQLTFVGVRSVEYTHRGITQKLFTMVSDKSWASLHILKRKVKPLDQLAKIASLAILWFCDSHRFEHAVNTFHQVLTSFTTQGVLRDGDPVVKGLKRVLDKDYLFNTYCSWEKAERSRFPLTFKPSGHTSGGLKGCLRL